MTGRGFDRHLLGLRLLLRPLSGEAAGLLEDELFERSAQWKLSTSGLSAGLLFKGTGLGAQYEDGYGINCMNFFFWRDKFLLMLLCRSCCTKWSQVWNRV